MLRTPLVLLLLLVPGAARADHALTLAETLELAARGNRDLAAARARLDQSAAGIELAWVALLPTVSAQTKYTRNYKDVVLDLSQSNQGLFALGDVIKNADPALMNPINQFEAAVTAATPAPITIQPLDQVDFTVNAAVPLVVPWAYQGLAAARKTTDAARANYRVTEATTLYAVAQAFYAAAGADELAVARRHAVAVAKSLLDNARSRFEAGVVNRTEVTRAELSLVRAEQALAESDDTQAQAYRSLATLIQLREPFHIVPGELPPPVEPEPVEVLAREALHLRPEFVAQARTAASFGAQADSARWRWAPTLSGFGNVHAFNYKGFSGNSYSWAVGVQLDWLLYDGGARDQQRHLALAQRRETEAQLSLLRDTVADELANDRSALATKQRALVTAQRSVDLSHETLELVRVQHDAGTATQLDLLQAQDALVAAEVAVAQARFDLALAHLTLERAAGTFPESALARSRP
jgi:outer membrane protein TolC